MKLEEYKNAYDMIQTNEEVDEKIMDILKADNGKRQGRKKKWYRIAYAAAACLMLVGISQIPIVKATASEVFGMFVNQIQIADTAEGTSDYVQMEGKYLTISEDAPTEECKMDSMQEAEDVLGIDLLTSELEYDGEDNLITYYASVDKKGQLYGIMLINSLYTLGDLKVEEVTTHEDWADSDSILYEEGKNYKTPILAQVTIRTDKNPGEDYVDHEIEYAGQEMDFAEGDAEVFELEQLDAKAVIFRYMSDGNSGWNREDVRQEYCGAMLVYGGVEYQYHGAVNTETMKEFLKSLQ